MIIKEAKIKATIMTIITVIIVGIIFTFYFIGNASENMVDSANSITDANNCSEGTDTGGTALTYNQTSKYCGNSTNHSIYLAGQYDLPLNSLFSSGGVAFLIVMAGVLIFLLSLVLGKSKWFKK